MMNEEDHKKLWLDPNITVKQYKEIVSEEASKQLIYYATQLQTIAQKGQVARITKAGEEFIQEIRNNLVANLEYYSNRKTALSQLKEESDLAFEMMTGNEAFDKFIAFAEAVYEE